MQVTVIGGGITGCFTSYYLLKRGHSVTLVDNESRAVKTSVYNSGSINAPPSFTSIGLSRIMSAYFGRRGPVYVSLRQMMRHPRWYSRALRAGANPYNAVTKALVRLSVGLYDDFIASENAHVDHSVGGLNLYRDGRVAENKAKEQGNRYVDEREALDMGFKGFGGAVLDDNRRVNPHLLCALVRRRVKEMGARIVSGDDVRLKRDSQRARVDDAGLAGDAYVLAAGAWSNKLCEPLGYSPQIMPARGLVMLYRASARPFDHSANFEGEGISLTLHGDELLRLTSFFELVGHDPTFGREREEWLLKSTVAHMARNPELRLVEKGVGFRPCSPDQMPVVGRVPRVENAFLATGGCRKGLTLAPVIGHMVSAALSGDEVDAELLRMLDPSRFG